METNLAKIQKFRIELPRPFNSSIKTIGIDPGTVNFGIAILDPNQTIGTMFQVKIERHDNPVQRIINIQHIMSDCVWWCGGNDLIIEGSSFGAIYRQVELAEIRASIVLWGKRQDMNVKIVPPKTIRKTVFGKGTIKAHEYWEGLPEDALAALACAYFTSESNMQDNPECH